jgi:hypothetical protein
MTQLRLLLTFAFIVSAMLVFFLIGCGEGDDVVGPSDESGSVRPPIPPPPDNPTPDPPSGELTLKETPIPDGCQSVQMHLKITQGESLIDLVPLPLEEEISLTQFNAPVDPLVAGEALKQLLGLPPNIAIAIGGIGGFNVSVKNSEFDFGAFRARGTFTVKGRIQNGIGDFDFGNSFNFNESLRIRIEITDSRGECGDFRPGQTWEFEGVPMNEGDDKYSLRFPQFDEVQ